MKKKIIALLLVLSMTIAMGGMAASAEPAKHERVYVVADSGGNVLSLTDSIRLENRALHRKATALSGRQWERISPIRELPTRLRTSFR